ncbi:MAG TPA: hypothetical protein VFB20_02650 [Burkholderiales bacterium]|nr:hypothetical protein [Burkholderiales bacterium]
MKTMLAIMLGALLCAGPASANEIKVHRKYGIEYVTGGNDRAERLAMQALAPRFPAHLYFVLGGSDQVLTGVKVTVRDVSGDVVLEATSEGPLFYFSVDGGRYTVDAEYRGEKISMTKDLVGRRYLELEFKFKGGA